MPGTLSKELQQQVIERTLSPHERNLLRLSGQGKSPDALSKLYRQYEGPNGVLEALEAIRAKVEAAAGRRLDAAHRVEEKPLREKLMDVAGEPAEADGSMNGAGAAPEAARVAATPPNGTAPAVDTGLSRNGSTPTKASPAKGKVRAAVAEARTREGRIVGLLTLRRMTPKAIAAEIGCSLTQAGNALERLQEHGVTLRTADSAYDWPDAVRHGRPGRVWRLVEEPEGCERADDRPAESARSRRRAARRASPVEAPARCCEHGVPSQLCQVCSGRSQLGGKPTGIPAESPAEFDARGLWIGWTERQRMQMTRVVLNALLGRLE